jgi:hypothetical protein
MPHPNFEQPQPMNFGQNNSGNHGSFGGNGSKGATTSKGPWGHTKPLRMLKQTLKGMLSRLLLTRMRNGRGVFLAEIATPRTRPRSVCLLMNSTTIVCITLVLTVAK